MNIWLDVAVLFFGLLACAVYEGSETAFYSVSRVRVELEARRGARSAKIVQRLLSDDVALLIVLLIGNCVVLELLTYRVADLAGRLGLGEFGVEVFLAVVVTPFVFFFGQVLPKDLFRRRAHTLLPLTAPFILFSRYLFWPVERLLRLTIGLVTRILGLQPHMLSIVRGREMVLRLLRESAQSGALVPQAEQLARNVLKLRSIEVRRAMVPWRDVQVLSSAADDEELRAAVGQSKHTRLPVLTPDGHVLGYVHQLDVLGDGRGKPVLEHLRPLFEVGEHTPVDRALARLRREGQRMALVGSVQSPLGILTLKDLVEEISGDLAGW